MAVEWGRCSGCGWSYRLRADRRIRRHGSCKGGGLVPWGEGERSRKLDAKKREIWEASRPMTVAIQPVKVATIEQAPRLVLDDLLAQYSATLDELRRIRDAALFLCERYGVEVPESLRSNGS
jgi:hypothetical protein